MCVTTLVIFQVCALCMHVSIPACLCFNVCTLGVQIHVFAFAHMSVSAAL